jgi:hypothetical protein
VSLDLIRLSPSLSLLWREKAVVIPSAQFEDKPRTLPPGKDYLRFNFMLVMMMMMMMMMMMERERES